MTKGVGVGCSFSIFTSGLESLQIYYINFLSKKIKNLFFAVKVSFLKDVVLDFGWQYNVIVNVMNIIIWKTFIFPVKNKRLTEIKFDIFLIWNKK